ncbi:Protein of unknown function [Pyronema omphalodes CBS 100304]|uniref:Uncharacterized protein n=1 Tax=Pyronema omphalodes (strain CBS 100304) TaxID=1076935 RepID=U4LTQ9_PYROM|nr:Protein of unknown function [Pyronema omphalodes CBS 100304]
MRLVHGSNTKAMSTTTCWLHGYIASSCVFFLNLEKYSSILPVILHHAHLQANGGTSVIRKSASPRSRPKARRYPSPLPRRNNRPDRSRCKRHRGYA